MRRILLLAVIPIARAFGAAAPLHAQAPGQQGAIMVPALSDQERWDRSSTLMVASFTAGIASYKALGKTAEDYGHYLGELFAPGWGAPNSGSAIPMARGGLFNYSALRGSDAEFVSASDTAAIIRFRRTHVAFFGAQRTVIGVSLDEYDQMTNAFNERLCAHLGLRCTIRNDGDWSYWTYTGRGRAAVVAFPRGTYSVTLGAQDVQHNAPLAGTWEFAWTPSGRFSVRQDGKVQVEGEYALALDQIAIKNETGPLACPGPATYRWVVDPTTNALFFGRLADDCDGRVQVLTTRGFTKK